MLADYHVHTEFSDDSVCPMEQVVRDAIGMGMEFGVQTHTIPKYEELFGKYPLDFVILSIHQVEDKEFWTQDFQKGEARRNTMNGIMKKCIMWSGHTKITVCWSTWT